MTPEEKANTLRQAIIKSNDGTPVLDALKHELPQDYQVIHIEPEEKLGNYDIVLKTPTDEICLIVSDDGLSARTGNIISQDHLDKQPAIRDDELSKLAVCLRESTIVDVQVIASKNDLEGK